MNRSDRFILGSTLFIWMCASAQAAEQSTAANQLGTFQVKVSNGYLSLEADRAPLAQIFQEIGKQARITFDSNVGPEERITIRLDRVPFEDAIKKLAKSVTLFYTHDPHDKTPRVSRVIVLSAAKHGAAGQAKASPEPVKVKEPATKSEPFKFQLDPAKISEKQKPRHQP